MINKNQRIMRMNNLFIAIVISLFALCSQAFAQSSYKNVYIARGDRASDQCSSCDWTKNCVYITNTNKYPVRVKFEYKLNSREAPWQSYIIEEDVPYSERQELEINQTDIPYGLWNYYLVACFGSEIKALRITYVDIVKPSAGQKILEGTDAFLRGYYNGSNQNK
jgi:hypothetical protein